MTFHQVIKYFALLFFLFQTGLSALHVAAQYGQIEVVREMLLKVSGTIKSESPAMMDNEKGPRTDVSVNHFSPCSYGDNSSN